MLQLPTPLSISISCPSPYTSIYLRITPYMMIIAAECSGSPPALPCFQNKTWHEMTRNDSEDVLLKSAKFLSSYGTNAPVKVSPSSVCSRYKKKKEIQESVSPILILLLSSGHSLWNIHRRVFVLKKRNKNHGEYSRWLVGVEQSAALVSGQ